MLGTLKRIIHWVLTVPERPDKYAACYEIKCLECGHVGPGVWIEGGSNSGPVYLRCAACKGFDMDIPEGHYGKFFSEGGPWGSSCACRALSGNK